MYRQEHKWQWSYTSRLHRDQPNDPRETTKLAGDALKMEIRESRPPFRTLPNTHAVSERRQTAPRRSDPHPRKDSRHRGTLDSRGKTHRSQPSHNKTSTSTTLHALKPPSHPAAPRSRLNNLGDKPPTCQPIRAGDLSAQHLLHSEYTEPRPGRWGRKKKAALISCTSDGLKRLVHKMTIGSWRFKSSQDGVFG